MEVTVRVTLVVLEPLDRTSLRGWLADRSNVYVGPENFFLRCSSHCAQEASVLPYQRILFDADVDAITAARGVSLARAKALAGQKLGYQPRLLNRNALVAFLRAVGTRHKMEFEFDAVDQQHHLRSLYLSVRVYMNEYDENAQPHQPLERAADFAKFVRDFTEDHRLFSIGSGSPVNEVAEATTLKMISNGELNRFTTGTVTNSCLAHHFRVTVHDLRSRPHLAELLVATVPQLHATWLQTFRDLWTERDYTADYLPPQGAVLTADLGEDDLNHLIRTRTGPTRQDAIEVQLETVSGATTDTCEAMERSLDLPATLFTRRQLHYFKYDETHRYTMNIRRDNTQPHVLDYKRPPTDQGSAVAGGDIISSMFHNQRPFVMRACAVAALFDHVDEVELYEYDDSVVGDGLNRGELVTVSQVCHYCGERPPTVTPAVLRRLKPTRAERRGEDPMKVVRRKQLQRALHMPMRTCCQEAMENPQRSYVHRPQETNIINPRKGHRPGAGTLLRRYDAPVQPEANTLPVRRHIWSSVTGTNVLVDSQHLPSPYEDQTATAPPDFFLQGNNGLSPAMHWSAELLLNPPVRMKNWVYRTGPLRKFTQRAWK